MPSQPTDGGLKHFQRRLKGITERAELGIRKAMEKSAQEIVDTMKALVPVDSGELRDSIGWTWGEKPKYAQAITSAKSPDGRMTITIFAGNNRVRYAHLVEFGTAPHIAGGMFEGAKHPGAAAHPFFFPAWRLNRKRVRSRSRRALKKAIKDSING